MLSNSCPYKQEYQHDRRHRVVKHKSWDAQNMPSHPIFCFSQQKAFMDLLKTISCGDAAHVQNAAVQRPFLCKESHMPQTSLTHDHLCL